MSRISAKILRGPRNFHLQPLQPADAMDNPFATFSEWTSEADEKAYAGLKARRRKNESARDKDWKSHNH